MRVSVVICTYNRASSLEATLESLCQQRYREFEVVVVNGPSTDRTSEVLREFPRPVRVVENPLANLSRSRNLGVRHAAGDVVAFIDDDALPEPAWLEQAVPHFAEQAVAGVGGIVFDHTGTSLQYGYSASSRFGETVTSGTYPYDALCVPGAAMFPYLQGTNALFRREALAHIGLFDEAFDFYLDETDVCCRLVDAGFLLRQLPDAPVHHKYLESARRNAKRTVTDWYSIVRNHVYFGYRHGLLSATEAELEQRTQSFVDSVLRDAEFHEERGDVSGGHVERTREQCQKAIADGTVLGAQRGAARIDSVRLGPVMFLPFLESQRPSSLRMLLVTSSKCSEHDPLARFLATTGPELRRAGQEVRLFRPGVDVSTVDLEAGVWVHRLAVDEPCVPADRDPTTGLFFRAVRDELARIEPWWTPDVVIGSMSDASRGVVSVLPDLPVVPITM